MANSVNDRQKVFQGASLVAIGLGFELLFSFFAKVGLARYLGTTGFGFFSIGFALVSVMTIVGLVGLPDGLARTLPRVDSKPEEIDTILTGLLASLLAVFIILLLIFLLVRPVVSLSSHGQMLIRVVHISSLGIPLLVICRLAIGVSRGYKKVGVKVLIQNLLRPGSFFVATAVVVILGIQNITATYVIPFSYLPGAAFGLFYLLKQFNHFPSIDSFKFRSELLAFSAPLMVSGFMRQILNHLDTFILAGFEPAAQIGIYNAVYPLSRLASVFLAAFGFIVMPVLSSADSNSENNEFNSIYHFATKWIVVGAVPIVLVFSLLPGELITIIYGSEYTSGQKALVILTLGICLNTILGPNTNALIALGESKAILRFTMLAAALNTVLNFILIPRFGINGAAIATAIATIALTILYSAELYRLEDIVPMNRNVFALIVSATATGISVSTALAWVAIPPIWTLLLFGLSFGPVYLGLVFATGTVSKDDVLELVSIVN